jgi:hypothetical protein
MAIAGLAALICNSTKSLSVAVSPRLRFRDCTIFWHAPVDELHSIENMRDRDVHFLLTSKIQGVQHTRSLTVSKVFPVGGKSGAEASSLLRACSVRSRGAVTVNGELLVEGTRKFVKGNLESRGVGQFFRLVGEPGAQAEERASRAQASDDRRSARV